MDALLFLILLTIIVLMIKSYTTASCDTREPPLAPELLPFIGHAHGLVNENNEYYSRISKRCGSPIFTLQLPWQKLYVATAPYLLSKIERTGAKHLSSDPLKHTITNRLVMPSTEARITSHTKKSQDHENQGAAFELEQAIRQGLQPGQELDTMVKNIFQDMTDCLDRRLPSSDTATSLKLDDLLRQTLTLASTNSIYGPLNPFKRNEIIDALWTLHDKSPALMMMPMPQLFARSAMKARETVANAFSSYLKLNGVASASIYTKLRYQALNKNGIEDSDIARYEIAIATATVANTVPAVFWMLSYVFNNPDLLSNLRQEIALVTEVTVAHGENRSATHVLHLTGLRASCPLLVSTLQEVLRFAGTGASIKKVLQDTSLDGKWLLKKDAIVLLPTRCIHSDIAIYGSDAKDFNPRRYMKGQKQATASGKLPSDVCFRTFGGGRALCPGRHFAINNILAICTFLISQYDIMPAVGEQFTHCSYSNSVVLGSLMPSDTEVQVKIKRRAGYEEARWKLVS